MNLFLFIYFLTKVRSVSTWFWHRPLLTQKRVTGLRGFSDTGHIGSKDTEAIPVTTGQVTNLKVKPF